MENILLIVSVLSLIVSIVAYVPLWISIACAVLMNVIMPIVYALIYLAISILGIIVNLAMAIICIITILIFTIFIPFLLLAAMIPAIKTMQQYDSIQKDNIRKIAAQINDTTRKHFLKASSNKKSHCQQLPSITQAKSHYKAAEDLTDQILNQASDAKISDRNTLLNILGNIGQKNGKNFLFYDSNTTKIDQNESKAKELKFTLNLDGFEPDQKVQNEVDTVMVMKTCIGVKQSHPLLDSFKDKLSRVYNVARDQIRIVDIFCGSINVTYVVDIPKNKLETYYKENVSGETGDIPNKMKKMFKKYKDCKIHALLYRDSFDINMFAAEGNKTFGSGDTYKVGPKGKEQTYVQPTGWVRFGLNVIKSGKYGSDHTWLDPFQHKNNWYRCYHGTGSSNDTKGTSVDVLSWIYDGGFHMAGNTAYGPGVYCSPDPKWLENQYAGTHFVNGKKYKFMLQCGANPNGVRIYQDKYCGTNWTGGKPWGPIWVANKPKDIRPYGILIKEI